MKTLDIGQLRALDPDFLSTHDTLQQASASLSARLLAVVCRGRQRSLEMLVGNTLEPVGLLTYRPLNPILGGIA